MPIRLCDYCRFEVPSDAIACGHCGKDIPYLKEERFCNKHKISYDVLVGVRSGNTTGRCTRCINDEAEDDKRRKEQIRKTEDEAGKKLANELAPLEKSLKNAEERQTALREHTKKNGAVDNMDLLASLLFLVFPIGSLIISALFCGLLNIGFFGLFFGLAYVGLCFFFIILPYIQCKSLEEEIKMAVADCSKIKQEINVKRHKT